MANDLLNSAPTDASGDAFVGAVSPADAHIHALEGGTTTTITGSPTGATAIRLVTESKDGGIASLGALADALYNGSGSASVIAALKGIYALAATLATDAHATSIVTNTAHTNPAGSNTALSAPPSTTNANTDTPLTFGSAVNHWCLQNQSTQNIYYNLDAAASTSTFVLAPNAQVWWDWPVTVLHVLTVTAINVNGASGLVLIGRA
jgi:hypothetical protein